MRSETKKRLLLAVLILIAVGWALAEWRPGSLSAIPYYEEMAANLRKLYDELQVKYASARTSSYGVFMQQNLAAIGGIYALFSLLLLLKPRYRDDGWKHLGALCFGLMAFVVWFVVGDWVAIMCHKINQAQGSLSDQYRQGIGSWFIAMVTGIVWPLLMIALGLTFWIGIPLYLLFLLVTLPSILFVILRLLVRLPLLTYHYLHYLTVSHPAESAYRAGMAEHIPIPELARTVADAMYQYDLRDFDALPKAWKSKNWTKRIDAFHDRLQAEDRFMEELIKNLRLKSQLRE
jgi:hypothetical protein